MECGPQDGEILSIYPLISRAVVPELGNLLAYLEVIPECEHKVNRRDRSAAEGACPAASRGGIAFG